MKIQCKKCKQMVEYTGKPTSYTYFKEKNKWMCRSCFLQKNADEAKKFAEMHNLPDLIGSEKEVNWANTIRKGWIEKIGEASRKFASKITQASTFITLREAKSVDGVLLGLRKSPKLQVLGGSEKQVAYAKRLYYQLLMEDLLREDAGEEIENGEILLKALKCQTAKEAIDILKGQSNENL